MSESFDVITYALLKKYHKKDGGSGTVDYSSYKVIEQKVASEVWKIKHDMNKYPTTTVIDSGNNVVFGDICYDDENNLTITFSAPFSGKLILS